MAGSGNRDVVTRYVTASASSDWDALVNLRTDDWVEAWPQSGERIRGSANYRAIHEQYPGGMPAYDVDRVVGSEDRWTMSALFTPIRVIGSGDVWAVEGTFQYPNGDLYMGVKHLELRDGRVAHETTYWAAPFEAAEWRREWVEIDGVRGEAVTKPG